MKKSKIGFALQIGVIIMLIATIALYVVCKFSGGNPAPENYSKAILTGEYTADGGSPVSYTNESVFEGNHEKSIVFKGHLKNKPANNEYLIISMENIWVEVKVDGKIAATNKRESKTNTPGYSIAYIEAENINENTDIEITLSNPYSDLVNNAVADFFDTMIIGHQNALYEELINHKSIEILVGVFIALLGIMTFSIAGLLIPKLKYQNFTFALVAFVGGLYLLTDSIYNYLPLIIKNPLLCFITDEGNLYILSIAFALYVLSNLKGKRRRNIVSLCALLLTAGTVTAFALQIFGVQDILQSEWIMYIIFAFTIPAIIVLLIMENIKKKTANAILSLMSFVPVLLAAVVELANIYLKFIPSRTAMRAGILATIIVQLINLIIATKKSYEESLNYERMQSELLKSRVLIMISQIQPHFLYNSLTSIAQLCEKNPKQAKTATIDFAAYLRGNMNSLKDNSPVPFEQELSHLKTYLSLEKMRFGEDLNIEYDIQTDEFYIPSLTVQPLVENAVKHGVGMKEDGGTVTIATRKYDDRYEVIVSDDGVGFDTSKPNPDTSRTHIGIENIKDRLSSMCNGEVVIESEIGKGTVSTIKIYKGEE